MAHLHLGAEGKSEHLSQISRWLQAEMEAVLETTVDENVEDLSPGGRFLIFNARSMTDELPDLSLLTLTGERKTTTMLSTPSRDDQAQFSAGGRWIAYHSDYSKGAEVFVKSFAPHGGGRQITNFQ